MTHYSPIAVRPFTTGHNRGENETETIWQLKGGDKFQGTTAKKCWKQWWLVISLQQKKVLNSLSNKYHERRRRQWKGNV
jgi:hypothetical protein